MSLGYRGAVDLVHGEVRLLIEGEPAPRRLQLTGTVSEQSLLAATSKLPDKLSRLTVIGLDCPTNVMTDAEARLGALESGTLGDAPGIELRQSRDAVEVVRGITSSAGATQSFPFGLVIVNDADDGRGGFVRRYQARSLTELLKVTVGGRTFAYYVSHTRPLSKEPEKLLGLVRHTRAMLPLVQQLIVWSPDGLPSDFDQSPYTTILTDPAFNLRAALAHTA